MAESHSDPGAAAAQEEAEETPGVGAGSVFSARQVKPEKSQSQEGNVMRFFSEC